MVREHPVKALRFSGFESANGAIVIESKGRSLQSAMPSKRSNRWFWVLIWLSVGFFALSSPCLLFGLLGLLGIAADVGEAENMEIGRQSLLIALIPIGLGILTLIVAVFCRRPK